MTNKQYNINSTDLARKLIKSVSTACLIAILQGCEAKHNEQITDDDRQELENLISEVA